MESSPVLLLVDDEPRGREMLEAILSGRGYVMHLAADGEEALVKAAQVVPDLILLDVMMPKLDGFEVCRRLRADPVLAEVPIILVTALDDRDSRLQGIEAGADDFVSKPIDRVELRARVHTVTRLNRYRRMQTERTKFERIAEHSADGYLLIDPGGAISYANPQARRYLGLPLEGAPSAVPFLNQAQARYRLEPKETWQHGFTDSTGGPRYLVRAETDQDQAVWLRVDILPMPVNHLGALLRLADVTEHLGFRREMWQFHTMLSHKLRTPLVGMIGSLHYLCESSDCLPPEEVNDLARLARLSAERLHSQIEAILRFKDGSRALPADANDLHGGFLISSLADTVGQIAHDLSIRQLTVRIEPGLEEARLCWAAPMVEAVVNEILENSIKFHPRRQPAITCEVARQGEGRVAWRLGDDGQNIAPDRLTQVWTPYYQGEKLFTGEVDGMGLGLARVADAVWEKGGECRMVNRPDGPGVVVELFLPLCRKPALAA